MLLKKLFIKNYKKTNLQEVRNNYGTVAGFYGLITNILLGLSKAIIGMLTNSITIMADAMNNISDTIASIITIVGFKVSNKKPTLEHPYGYARYEFVADLFVSLFVLIMGIVFAKESIMKIIKPEPLQIGMITYIILIIAILIKISQVYIFSNFAKEINSNTLKSTSIDSRNDVISTSTILLSMIFMSVFNINIDGYIGLIVSLFVIFNAIIMLKDSLNPLIGQKPTKTQVDFITNKLLSYKYVLGIHDLIIHNYGIRNDFITVHIELDSNLDFVKAHKIADIIEEDFYKKYHINITIHMDPVVVKDDKTKEIEKTIIKLLKEYNSSLTIHDFRIIENEACTKILFDCVEPFDKDYKSKDIALYLKSKIDNDRYEYIIKIDRPLS